MQPFTIQSNQNELVIRFDKSQIDTTIFLKIAKRMQLEYLSQKADIQENISLLVEDINNEWWKNNEEMFLKDVKK
jgi:hypothetical protein